ncbi:type III restriction endonuclease subunit M [Bacillus sp. VT 712]|uniref:DNA methyltransferase n=1 Tax=Bacillaceae TaxID=186817 RepID=UPI0005575633|nr:MULTISPECIES: site-specific DNA-methyltransferase [Bacillaceae]KZB92453.1 type III restriction endonuclease subunit M [Bacillus sp. VT 712]
MAKIEPKIFDELKKALSSFAEKYFVGEELNRSKLTDDLRNYDEALLSKLFEVEFIKQHFIKEVAGQKLFQIEQLEEAILYNDYWDTSYTKYENRVGLASKGKFLQDSQDVVLDFPFKDGVLTASMTKEDREESYDDAFLNETIEKDEIDRLCDKKILTNVKRFGKTQAEQHSTKEDYRFVTFDKKKDNLIIKGNNLLALHTLKNVYFEKVKLIYLDPPYNTGNDGFGYNDKFNHSTWLTFMKNRLEIAWQLLSPEGSIWVTLDDKEAPYARVLMDDIFGAKNYRTAITWRHSDNSNNNALVFSEDYNTILVYSKEVSWKPNFLNDMEKRKHFKNPDNDPRGPWFDGNPVNNPGLRVNLQFDITTPNGNIIKHPQNGWRWSKETMDEKFSTGELRFSNDQTRVIRRTYLNEMKGLPPSNLWINLNQTGHTRAAKYEQKKLFPELPTTSLFSTPKPELLLKYILELTTEENDLVLDFYMGSATTQAVALKMNRRFIGIEQMDYINTVSVPRLQKVIDGEQGGISKDLDWQGGGSFVYAELFPKNMGYLQDIIHSNTTEELKSVYGRMLQGTDTDEPADISFRADLSKIDWAEGFDANKRLLVKLLDKNGLYYNYSEIEDTNVRDLVSDEDYAFNKAFYEGGE